MSCQQGMRAVSCCGYGTDPSVKTNEADGGGGDLRLIQSKTITYHAEATHATHTTYN